MSMIRSKISPFLVQLRYHLRWGQLPDRRRLEARPDRAQWPGKNQPCCACSRAGRIPGRIRSPYSSITFPYPVRGCARPTAERRSAPRSALALQQGERILLDRRDGSGKSRLAAAADRAAGGACGTLSLGSGLVISYVPQGFLPGLPGTLEDFAAKGARRRLCSRRFCARWTFARLSFEKRNKFLPPGREKGACSPAACVTGTPLPLGRAAQLHQPVHPAADRELIQDISPAMAWVEHDRAFSRGLPPGTVRLRRFAAAPLI